MKQIITLILFFLLSFSFIKAQNSEFNLKNLDQVKIIIVDHQNVFSEILTQKIITDTKLQLMSAGIKAANEENKGPILQIKVRYIKSNMAEHRILVQLNLIEHVKTGRKSSISTDAITYTDDAFFVSKDVSTAAYNKLKDEMLIHFIEKYLADKSKT